MNKSMKQNRLAILAVSVCLILAGATAWASPSPELVKQEAGYYYGYGQGTTLDEATLEARRDLISNALTTAVRTTDAAASRVSVTAGSAQARLTDLKPFVKTKSGVSPAVTVRIKTTEWDKREKAYSDALRTELSTAAAGLADKKTVYAKIEGALEILAKLSDNGETELLTADPAGSELLSRRIESFCAETAKSFTLTLSVKDGFIDPNSTFSVKVSDASGNAVAGLPLSITWETPDLPTDAAAEAQPVTATLKTDSQGNAQIEYPAAGEYRNRPVTLTVTTEFAVSVPASAALKKLDAENAVDGRYIHCTDLKTAYPSVNVPAGNFEAGAVPQDTRAGRKEAAHTVTTDSFDIDIGPVTNARYAEFLHATRAENVPEYFDNSDYNQGSQPVVGISVKDAEAYAEWLSAQTGCTYRLPTEEEWEKAARAGKNTIYPWGDDSPADGKKANYKGNGTYAAPSPAGAFENGKNAWGLADMAGNVWEWTSSSRSQDTQSAYRIVKGGSWMDGPADLRISNFRELDGSAGYPDVGFRLVKEISK